MKKKISFDYDEEDGLTIATLKTSKGTFYGISCKHPDDKFHSSYSVGTDIAEARAHISFINSQIYDKKNELKGLNRLLAAMPDNAPGIHYPRNLRQAIIFEIDNLKKEKELWKSKVNQIIEGRKIYIRSRSATKEEKEKMRAAIAESFKTLSQVKTAKEEE